MVKKKKNIHRERPISSSLRICLHSSSHSWVRTGRSGVGAGRPLMPADWNRRSQCVRNHLTRHLARHCPKLMRMPRSQNASDSDQNFHALPPTPTPQSALPTSCLKHMKMKVNTAPASHLVRLPVRTRPCCGED